MIENDTASKDQKKISANGNEPTKQNSKSAFSPFKKKSQASLPKKRKRGMPKEHWVVDRVNLDAWNKINAHDDSVLISKCTDQMAEFVKDRENLN